MRLFLAIELPKKIKTALELQLTDIKREYPGFNWVSPENFHCTVHFFGERNDLEKIKQKVKDLIWDKEKFYIYSKNIDVIANDKLLVFLTFFREKRLEDLAQTIKDYFGNGNLTDRKFLPHLTLARGKRSSKQQYFVLKKRLEKISVDVSFKVTEIVLFESILEGKKPLYKKLASFELPEA